MSGTRPRLAFISPVFLLPNDTGGKIRTSNILRGLKGGAFHVTLVGPGSASQQDRWAPELGRLCDEFVPWRPATDRPRWMRSVDLFDALPVNVVADRTAPALETVRSTLSAGHFDVAVFDFVHAAVMRPARIDASSVCFTHNVEAEIFERHAQTSSGVIMRRVWTSQAAKMRALEGSALPVFDAVVAVSERDAVQFRQRYGVSAVETIPTGVDLEYFAWSQPPAVDAAHAPTVVFTGSMDWDANVDGVRFFLEQVWPAVHDQLPEAIFVVVGRAPPAGLVELGARLPNVRFTGFVDDVRPHVRGAHAFVIPLRVGGGTRIKAFEAMAMGCPVVSTSIGVEGLDIAPDEHYLRREAPAELADALVLLLSDADLRQGLSQRARGCVEQRFGHRRAAQVFEDICLRAVARRATMRQGAGQSQGVHPAARAGAA